MPALSHVYDDLFAALIAQFGRPPVADRPESTFEAVLAAAFTHVADARKAAVCVDALRDAGLLEPGTLAGADRAEVRDTIRQVGVNPTTRLMAMLSRVAVWFDARVDGLEEAPTESLRDELRTLNGIGPAAADAILLHGLARPVYPLDRGTYRVLIRHGWIDQDAGYDEARDAIEPRAGGDPAALATLAHGFSRVGAEFCRVAKPRCERCPLRTFLPPDGPLAPDPEG